MGEEIKEKPVTLKLSVGNKVKFQNEKRPYTVRCCDDRFAICTKSFAAIATVVYTIIDLKEKVRGTENLVLSGGFETDEDCHEALERLQNGESEVSHRNRIELDIISIS